MATKSKHSTASVLPTNEAIWSGRKLSVPSGAKPRLKATKVKQSRKGKGKRK
jgi:hypothetical protein